MNLDISQISILKINSNDENVQPHIYSTIQEYKQYKTPV